MFIKKNPPTDNITSLITTVQSIIPPQEEESLDMMIPLRND